MSRVKTAIIATVFAAAAIPTAALADCCSPPPPPCCVQQQIAPPVYRTVQETVMVSPGRVIAHRSPPEYRTVMVPKTVMVPRTVMASPGRVHYEQIPPQYATQQRVEMVQPAQAYYVQTAPRCGGCGY